MQGEAVDSSYGRRKRCATTCLSKGAMGAYRQGSRRRACGKMPCQGFTPASVRRYLPATRPSLYNQGQRSESEATAARLRMDITDAVGGRGEAIAFARLARVCRTDADLPYFWPHYLGEKCPTYDFLVELVDAGEKTPFFHPCRSKTTRRAHEVADDAARCASRCRRRMCAPGRIPGPDLRRRCAGRSRSGPLSSGVHGTMNEAIPSITTARRRTEP